jgi:thioredoxin reductase
MHDVSIIGAGPAGLNAALILGRCRREVVVFDSGQPRNAKSRGLHGFLSRDGTPPLVLRDLGRAELTRYPNVRFRDVEVSGVFRGDGFFELALATGERVRSRILLLATGRVDLVPDRPGFREFYGHGVYHCPYCDGWEHRDSGLVAYGRGQCAYDYALELLTWSQHITLCSDGPDKLSSAQRETLSNNGIQVNETEIAGLRGQADRGLTHVLFKNGEALPCDALFFQSDCVQQSPLAESLGCKLDENGAVPCTGQASTEVPGLYVAGNVRGGLHLAIMAAAEGAEAGVAINNALAAADLR